MVIQNKHILCFVLFWAFFSGKAQQNLVPNHDFSTYSACPTLYAQLNLAVPWGNISGHGSTAEFFNSCFVVTPQSGLGWGAPVNGMGYQQPFSGTGYAGLFTFANVNTTTREYIQVPLSSPLIAGVTYYVGFYVSLADNVKKASDGFGAYLSVGPVISPTTFANLPVTPQISNPPGNIIFDKINWTLISGYFTALGGENYLTIGNFSTNANTLTATAGETGANMAYYYVDAAFVIPPITVFEETICLGDSITLQAPHATQYAWADSLAPSVILSTDSTFTVSPTNTTTYFIYGSVDTTTIIVNVNSTSFPPPIDLGNDTTLCVGESLILDVTALVDTYAWQDSTSNSTYNVVQPGVYWVTTMLDNCLATDTIEVFYSPLPLVDLGNDTTLCFGDSLVFEATYPDCTYLWQDGSTDSTFTILQQGIYHVSVTNANNCTSIDSITVNYFSPLILDLGNDTTFCPGDSILLDATNVNASYMWQDNSTSAIYTANQQGTFWVTVSANNCSVSDTILIDYNLVPQINLGNDTSLCLGATLLLDANTPNASYLWQDNSTNATFTVIQQGIYSVVVTSSEGCVNADTIQVLYIPAIVVDLGPDLSLCQSQTITLDATALNATYLWQDGTTSPQFQITQTGHYFVDVTNACETVSDTVNVSYFVPPIHPLGSDTILCEGATMVLSINIPGSQTLWQDQTVSNTYLVSSPGTYSAVTTTPEGCLTSDEITIDFLSIPELDLGPDRLVCKDEPQFLHNFKNGHGSYLWSTGSTDSQIATDSGGVYSLVISNQCGTVVDTIKIGESTCQCEVYIPNAFTPDSDEHNPVFGAKYDCLFTMFKMIIFNRWGEMIWETNDPDTHWDGTYQNKKAADGIYIYKVNYSSESAINEVLTGHFVILR